MTSDNRSEWLLRFEAADFANTVFDMPKLSPIRGASLSYLYSPEWVAKALAGLKPKEVYTGASQGAWTFAASSADAEKTLQAVRATLRQDDAATGAHSHLAYVVSLVKGSDAKALAAAESACNVQKLQGEGFPLPKFDTSAEGFDERGDRERPALPGCKIGKDLVSAAHMARHEFGKDQRQGFYTRMSGRRPTYDFTDDFEAMMDSPPSVDGVDLPVSLQNKVAVFFADGNKLNCLRQKATENGGLDGLQKFSDKLKADQKGLLGEIVDWLEAGAENSPDAFLSKKVAAKDELRFETLMWGGDEVLFVMPAWLGLDFAGKFFEWTKGWKTPSGDNLTYSAGLVICGHKTPIRQSKEIAEKLARACKDEQPDGKHSALQIEVFESLSLPVGDFNDYRNQLYAGADAAIRNGQLTIAGKEAGEMFAAIARIKQDGDFPRSQLYRLLRLAARSEFASGKRGENGELADEALRKEYENYRQRAGEGKAPEAKDLEVIPNLANGAKAGFAMNLAMISMLWDYAAPLEAGRGEEA